MLPVWVAWTAIQHFVDVSRLYDHATALDDAAHVSKKGGNFDEYRNVDESVTQQQSRDRFARSIFQQSLCDARSSFVTLELDGETVNDTNNPRSTASIATTWAARLVYLMLHEHQNNYLEGDSKTSDAMMRNSTKFLVFSYGKSGCGANMRLGAVPALMLGLVTDRVVINVNNASSGPAYLQAAWPWATCSLGNADCYFRPLTTAHWESAELEHAHELSKSEARLAFRTGRMPEAHQDDRFLILHVTFRPQREPETLRNIVSSKVEDTVRKFRWTHSAVVKEALRIIAAVPTISDGEYDYYGANSVIFRGLLLYAMRPNLSMQKDLNEKVDDVTQWFDTTTVGLPIRGTPQLSSQSSCVH